MRRAKSAVFRIQGSSIGAGTQSVPNLADYILQGPAFPLAACANRDPELWSDKVAVAGNELTAEGREAVAVCNRCAHLTDCLQWALDNDERHGILGGLTPAQRRSLTR